MEKVILYYKFVPVKDPEMTRLWQTELCLRLGLKGRIIISQHGINGTLGGSLDNLKIYKSTMNKSVIFKGIKYKWSSGGADNFPRLSVKVRDEIVTFHVAKELKVTKNGLVGGGQHLSPDEVHTLIEKRGDEVVFFDGRNKYEAAIGKFKNAVVTDVENTRDFIKEIEKPKYDKLKNKPIVTYCTGGIRCEVLTVIMKNRGFKEVYQVDGGIIKYGEKFADDGQWEGKLHIFDNRMVTQFSDKAKDIGNCIHCLSKTSNYINCSNKACNKLVLVCSKCAGDEFCAKCNSVTASGLA